MNDDAPWNEEEIIGVDTRVHPQSQLAVSYDKNTVFIFYQKPDGSLSGINEYNDKWKAIELPTVAALNGTPLATCNTNSAVFLFYMSVDGTVRYIENSEGEWKGAHNISLGPRLADILNIARRVLFIRRNNRSRRKVTRYSPQADYCRR